MSKTHNRIEIAVRDLVRALDIKLEEYAKEEDGSLPRGFRSFYLAGDKREHQIDLHAFHDENIAKVTLKLKK
jgi:hypothetical protein